MDSINITPEVEYANCAEDFTYFCKRYLKIIHPVKGLIPLELYDFQEDYIRAFENHRFVIVNKFRQGGFTTIALAWFFWRAMFNEHETILFVSKTDRECCAASEIVRRFANELPDWMHQKLNIPSGRSKTWNDHTRSFDSGSEILFRRADPCCGRSADYLFLDEPAFWRDADKKWKALYPIVSTGGNAYAVSTPNGKSGWFYETYQTALKNENSFHIFHTDYHKHPDYNNQEWVANTKKGLGIKGWRQEVLGEFLEYKTLYDDKPESNDYSKYKDQYKMAGVKLGAGMAFGSKFPGDDQEEFINKAKDLLDKQDPKVKDLLDEEEWDIPNSIQANIPKAYQFKQLTGEQIKKNFQKAHTNWNPTNPVDHPDFDNDVKFETIADIAVFWQDAAELYPSYECQRDYWAKAARKKYIEERKLEERISFYCDEPHLLWLSGVIQKTEMDECKVNRVGVEVLNKVMESTELPEDMDISFFEGQLCVAGVPTIINEDDVRDMYNGLNALKSHGEAISEVVDLVKERLKVLFRRK